MSTTNAPHAVEPIPGATSAPFSQHTRRRGAYSVRRFDILGVAWLHGALHVSVFQRQVLKRSWRAATPVKTLEEFEVALDEALIALRFGGSEVFVILEHEAFQHQSEHAPDFSDAATKTYLKGRMQRHEQEHGPALWVSQRTLSTRKEATFLLHILPSTFYQQLSSALQIRRLDLTRILPVVVPLQLTLQAPDMPKDQPLLLVAETGDATTLMATRPDGELLFARTMLARWDSDPARIGVEVNRSLLYAKQQFGVLISHISLIGSADERAVTEVQNRCGVGKEVTLASTGPAEWLQAIARLTPRHPINLVAGYLSGKRAQQLLRRSLCGVLWALLCIVGLNTWLEFQEIKTGSTELQRLQSRAASLETQQAHLQEVASQTHRLRDVIREVSDERTPPLAPRFLPYVASVLPAEARLTLATVKWEPASNQWEFRLEGTIDGDEETGHEVLNTLEKGLTRGALGAALKTQSRSLVPVIVGGAETSSTQRFVLEGAIGEK